MLKKIKSQDDDGDFTALKKAAMPLVEYLRSNHNPHVVALVSCGSIELLSGLMNLPDLYNDEEEAK